MFDETFWKNESTINNQHLNFIRNTQVFWGISILKNFGKFLEQHLWQPSGWQLMLNRSFIRPCTWHKSFSSSSFNATGYLFLSPDMLLDFAKDKHKLEKVLVRSFSNLNIKTKLKKLQWNGFLCNHFKWVFRKPTHCSFFEWKKQWCKQRKQAEQEMHVYS